MRWSHPLAKTKCFLFSPQFFMNLCSHLADLRMILPGQLRPLHKQWHTFKILGNFCLIWCFKLLLCRAIELTVLFTDHTLTFSVAPWILSYLQRLPQLQEQGLSSLSSYLLSSFNSTIIVRAFLCRQQLQQIAFWSPTQWATGLTAKLLKQKFAGFFP